MTKILFYINVLNQGGAERVIANLANQFSENDYEVMVVNTFPVKKEYYLKKKIKHIYLEEQSKRISFFVLRNIKRIFFLRKIIKEFDPDVSISFMAEPNIRLLCSTINLRTKKIVSVRNDPKKEYSNFLILFLFRKLLKNTDAVVFQTNDAQSFFGSIKLKNSVIIPNPVAKLFYNKKQNIERRNIVNVGRLTSQKNHKLLIETFASLSDQIMDNLYIYGEGELREDLENLIVDLNMKDRIFLEGNVDAIESHIFDAKLFVLSSDYEGMPNSLMEAMALGVPCISTDCPCGGPRDLLSSNFLFTVRNPQELGKLILNVISDENKLTKMSKENIEKSLIFREDNIFSAWEELIVKVMKE